MDQQPTTPTFSNPPAAPMQAMPQPSPQAPPELDAAPATWTGGFGLYKYSKQAMKRNWQTFLVLVIISVVLSGIPYSVKGGGAYYIVELITLLLSFFISIATIKTVLKSIRGKSVTIGEALQSGFDIALVLKYFVAGIIVGFLLLVSFVLFVIPYFFVVPRLILFQYFLVDKNMGPMESITASWNATKGHALKVWSVFIATFAMALLALTIIGIPFALYFLFMYAAAMGVLYVFVTNQQVPEAVPVLAAAQIAPTPLAPPTPPAPTV